MASAKLHPLIAFIGARFEYIRCMHIDVAIVPVAIVDDTVRSIASHISQSRQIKIEDGVAIQTAVSSAPLPDEAIAKLKLLVHEKVGIAPTSPAVEGADDKRQEHRWLESFQTDEDWKVYDMLGNAEAKMTRMAMRCCSIKCVKQTEHTSADAVAIALHRDGPLMPDVALDKVRTFRHYIEEMGASIQRHTVLPTFPQTTMAEWGSNNAVLYAAAYQGMPPVPCPLDPQLLHMLKAVTPCRSSRAGCTHVGPRRSQSFVLQPTQPSQQETMFPGLCNLPGFTINRSLVNQPQRTQTVPRFSFQPTSFGFTSGTQPAGRGRHTMAVGDQQPDLPASGQLAFADTPGEQVATSPPPSQAPSPSPSHSPLTSAAASPCGSVPQTPTPALHTAASMAAKWKAAVASKHDENSDEDEEVMEKPCGGKKGSSNKKSKAKKAVKPNVKTATASKHIMKKPAIKSTLKKTAATKKVDDLKFIDDWQTKKGMFGPRYYKDATIYCDLGRNLWRVKPCNGSRKTAKFRFGVGYIEQRQQWSKVLAYIKSLFQ